MSRPSIEHQLDDGYYQCVGWEAEYIVHHIFSTWSKRPRLQERIALPKWYDTIIRFNTTLRCDIIKCKIKLSFVTGTYSLQAHRSKFNQFDVKPTCLLCDEGPETREHFLTTCEKLDAYRSIYTDKIRDVLSKNLGSSDVDDIMNSREGLTQLLMDCTSDVITRDYPLLSEDARKLELLSQKLIYALHLTRKRMLSILAPLHRRKAPKAPKKVTNSSYPLLQHIESVESTTTHSTTHSTDLWSGAPEYWRDVLESDLIWWLNQTGSRHRIKQIITFSFKLYISNSIAG